MSSQDTQSTDDVQIRATYNGFYKKGDDPDSLLETYECTLFITDTELVIGAQGKFQPMGGLLKLVPEGLTGIATKFAADDNPRQLTYDEALNNPRSERLDLTDIAVIEVEKDLPPFGKSAVELEMNNRYEWGFFIGTAKSHGGKEETREFVDTLEQAALDAGGSPHMKTEYDL